VFFIAHSANGLPSVKFDTRQKKVVCRVFFQNTLGEGLLFAECFWNYTRQTYFPKKFFFLSILLLFAECFLKLHSANLFSKEKKIFAGLDWNSSSSDSVR